MPYELIIGLAAKIFSAIQQGRMEDAAQAAEQLANLARATDTSLDRLDAAAKAALERGGNNLEEIES